MPATRLRNRISPAGTWPWPECSGSVQDPIEPSGLGDVAQILPPIPQIAASWGVPEATGGRTNGRAGQTGWAGRMAGGAAW